MQNIDNLEINMNLGVIGIMAETKSPWERRVALTPLGCKILISEGIKVLVQPSRTRCFSDDEYKEAGCELVEDISPCNLIICLQYPEISSLLPEKTYMMFSHCKKGKTENQVLLEKILEKKIRLIDYECIKEDKRDRSQSQRLVSFGRIAGIAGTINLLKGIGELLLARQVSTPFVFTKLAYMYTDLQDALHSLKTLGDYIIEQYLPEQYSPFFIAVLGNGRVSQGVQEALKCLPNQFITPKQLVDGDYQNARDKIFVVIFDPSDLYVKNIGDFETTDFIKNPENYSSIFDSKYLKYFHAIINCLYWDSRHPKILTKKSLRSHVTMQDSNLVGVSDISCDLNGAIEILDEYTTFQKPFFVYEPVTQKKISHVDSATKEGIIYHAIPNLAANFSVDASEHFCNLLIPYIKTLTFSKYPLNFEDQILPSEIKNACICSNGFLTQKYKNIFRNTEEKKKVESNLIDESFKPYFISLKMKGHIFDSGFFSMLIETFSNYRVGHKINFLNIGEGPDLPSILYIDIFGKTIEDVKNFINMVKKNIEIYNLEFDILKSNIN